MNRAEILGLATDCVTRDRASTHGRAEDSLGRIAALWSADLGVPLTGADVARLMVLFKVARLRGNPWHLDSWVDTAGYAAIGGELAALLEQEVAAARPPAPISNPGRVPDGFAISPAGTIAPAQSPAQVPDAIAPADFSDRPVGPKNPHGPAETVEAPLPGASPDTDPAPSGPREPAEIPVIPDEFTAPPAAPVGPVEDADGQQPQSEPRPATPAGSTGAADRSKWSAMRASAAADETYWPPLVARVLGGESAAAVAVEVGCNFNRLVGKVGWAKRMAVLRAAPDPAPAPAPGQSSSGPLKSDDPGDGAAVARIVRAARPAPTDLSALNPKRGWTLDDRRRASEMRDGGAYPSAIAEALGRDLKQVQNFLMNIRLGRSSVTAAPRGSNQLVPVKARPENLIPTVNGHRAIDPAILDTWEQDRADKSVEGFVRTELYQGEA